MSYGQEGNDFDLLMHRATKKIEFRRRLAEFFLFQANAPRAQPSVPCTLYGPRTFNFTLCRTALCAAQVVCIAPNAQCAAQVAFTTVSAFTLTFASFTFSLWLFDVFGMQLEFEIEISYIYQGVLIFHLGKRTFVMRNL